MKGSSPKELPFFAKKNSIVNHLKIDLNMYNSYL